MTKEYKYMVRTYCATYNHEPYILDALKGFVMQQTNFPMVFTIVDDASTDRNAEVIRCFVNENFDLLDTSVAFVEDMDYGHVTFAQHRTNRNCFFAVVFLKENHYSQHKSKAQYIQRWMDAKYIALCEGDDYWTDPLKLKKQVEFLEDHEEYSMCFHKAAVLDYLGKGCWLHCFDIENRDYSGDEFISQWIVPTNSVLYRSECSNYPIIHREKIMNGDIVIVLSCAQMGKVRGMSDCMSVYRIHQEGVTYDPAKQHERTMRYPEHFECIRDNFPMISKNVIDRLLGLHYYYRSLIQIDKKLQKSDYETAMLYIPQILKQKRKEELKHGIKKVLSFPFHRIFS